VPQRLCGGGAAGLAARAAVHGRTLPKIASPDGRPAQGGLAPSRALLICDLLAPAERRRGEPQIVSRRATGELHRATCVALAARARRACGIKA
jgi:hypothetical protein